MRDRTTRISVLIRLLIATSIPFSPLLSVEAEFLMQLSRSGYDDELAAGQFQPMGAAVYFIAESSGTAIGLWKADANSTNTTLIKDLGTKKLVLRGPFEINGLLLFVVSGPGVNAGDPRRYELWRSDGSAGGTTMLKALGQEFGTAPDLITKTSSLLFFNAAGLWRTDGTAAGTVRVTGGGGARLTRFGEQLLFTTFDSAKGELLWKTDGTIPGTVLVADINPSSANNRFSTEPFLDVNGTAFFGADDGMNGMQLWKTDGTESGTRPVGDMAPKSLTGFNGKLFFLRDRELWRSDGSEAGTVLVSKPYPEKTSVQVGDPQTVGRHLWFGVYASGKSELWRSDGSADGTGPVALLADSSQGGVPGASALPAEDFIAFQNEVFFRAYQEVLGVELWRTDGTVPGTRIAVDLNPGTMDLQPTPLSSNPGRFAVLDNQLFLIADLPGTAIPLGKRPKALWRLGPPAPDEPLPDTNGIRMVKDINPIGHGVYDSQSTQGREFVDNRLFAFKNRVYFFGREPEHGLELWSSDGTEEGTRMVKDINLGTGSINLETAAQTSFIEHHNQLYFCVASVFPDESPNLIGLWRTDGTESGTILVWPGKVIEWTRYGEFLFVSGWKGNTRGLWRIGGIPEQIVPVHLREVDPRNNLEGNSPEFLAGFQGQLFFVATSDTHGRELWRTDTTFTNIVEVKNFHPDIPAPIPHSSYVSAIVPAGENCFLVARSSESGLELWKTDGTEEGTVIVKDISPGVRDAFEPGNFQFASMAGQLYFSASFSNSIALWTSDGTEAGTRVVHSGTGRIFAMRALGNRLYFSAVDSTMRRGQELWISDGTESGTFMLANINPDQPPVFAWGSSPELFEAASGQVYFKAGDNRYGAELWKTDGSPQGTTRVVDVNPIPAPAMPPENTRSYRGSSYPSSITVAGTNLFFAADNGTFGRELWVMSLAETRPPALTSFLTSSRGLRIKIAANPGMTYRLLRATNLMSSWLEIASGTIPDSGTAEVDDDNRPAIAAFYRVQSPNR